MSFFRRKKVDFYQMLLDQAEAVKEGMEALVTYMKDPQPANGGRVLYLEEKADSLRARLAQELNQVFVTPMDPEDINALSRSVDDIIDYGKSTVEEMMAFQVGPNAHLLRMAEGLCEGATAIAAAITALPVNKSKANEQIIFAKKRENFVEHCYREALVDLFKGDNVVAILKMREIYRHLSNAADRSDEAANVVANILVKSM